MSDGIRDLDVVNKKVHTTLSGFASLIISEIVQQELSIARGLPKIKADCIYAEGIMGMGKSQSVVQAHEKVAEILRELTGYNEPFGYIDLRLAGMTGSDLQGIPITQQDAERIVLKWVKDTLLPGIASTCAPKGIILLDELNQVEDRSVLSLLYQFILDGKINDYVLPEGWYIVACGNREEDGGVYNRLPAPVRDRMVIIEVDVSKTEWLDNYARPRKVHPSVIAFIQADTHSGLGYLHTYDPELEGEGDEKCINYVFATPRSWVAVSDALYAYENPALNPANIRALATGSSKGRLTTEDTLKVKLGGLLGDDLAIKFVSFYKDTMNCNVDEILSINWVDGKPDKEVSISDDNLIYLLNLASYPTDAELEKSMKILYFLASRGTSLVSVDIITQSYTVAQNNVFVKYTADTGNTDILVGLSENSKRMQDAIKANNIQL